MKLAMFRENGEARLGIVEGNEVLDILQGECVSTDVKSWLARGPGSMDALQDLVGPETRRIPLCDVSLLPPINPAKFLAIGGNYKDHLKESGMQLPPHQIWFNKQISCIAGPHDAIVMPRVSTLLDYEGELAVVIGKRCRHVRPEEALACIAGYMIGNDVSVRDWQMRSPTAMLGKSFDTHGPLGPWLVTADEIPDPQSLHIRTWVNDELRQDGSTSQMIHDIAHQIAELTTVMTLDIGDVLLTGTPSGVGIGMTPPTYLKVGDRVRVQIEGIGEILNNVVAETETSV